MAEAGDWVSNHSLAPLRKWPNSLRGLGSEFPLVSARVRAFAVIVLFRKPPLLSSLPLSARSSPARTVLKVAYPRMS